jgi:hypothetical protein
MSSVVKTITPFLNREILLQALDIAGCRYTIQGDEIVMLKDQRQRFIWDSVFGRFKFSYYSHNYRESDFNELKAANNFFAPLEKAYNDIYCKKLEELEKLRLETVAEAERKRLEEERLRLERERQEYVEKQKAHIIAKAKEKGYSVREEKVKEKIKLVLVRNTYK